MEKFGLTPDRLALLRRIAIYGAIIAAIALASFIGFVASIDLKAIETRLVDGFRSKTGATLEIASSELRAWPSPRIILNGVSIRHAQAQVSLQASRSVIRMSVIDLVDGHVDRPRIDLDGARLEMPLSPFKASITTPHDMLAGLFKVMSLLDGNEVLSQIRLSIRHGRITLVDPQDARETLVMDPVQASLHYSAASGRLDLALRKTSEIRPFEMSASLPTTASLPAGRNAPIQVQASGFGSRFMLQGKVNRERDIAVTGAATATIDRSIEAMFGLEASSSKKSEDGKTAVETDLILDNRGVGLQALRITRDGQGLAGVAALRENNGRWTLAGTLAGDLFDGSAAHAAIGRLREPGGRWSRTPLVLNPIPAVDLDLRISTREFRLGALTLRDVALSMFTRGDKLEFAIADAKFGDGTFKARVSVNQRGPLQDVRVAFSGDRIEADKFFDSAFGLSRIKGNGQFAAQLDAQGESIERLAASLQGSARIDIRSGELTGLDLQRLMNRMGETRPEAAVFMALGGRTPFEQLFANFSIRDGRIEPAGAKISAGRVEGGLEGVIDLPAFRHDLTAILRRVPERDGTNGDFFGARIEGNLLSPSIRMDQTLINKKS